MIDRGSFLIAHLTLFIVPPLHQHAQVQLGHAVMVATDQFVHAHLLHLVVLFNLIIGEAFHFDEVPHVPQVPQAEFALEVVPAREDLGFIGN